LVAVAAVVIAAGCTYYETAPGVYSPAPASTFDRAWNAALGAAADEGVQITSQDRATGAIRGTKEPFNVDMNLRSQADGNVRVEINARGPQGVDPTLAERISRAYDRRMGR
jgi:hypothetical protein